MGVDNEQVLKAAFDTLIKQNASKEFGEALMMEEIGDFFLLSDLETYEIYRLEWLNGAEKMPEDWRVYEGRKCYELFQHQEEPCAFCNKALQKQSRGQVGEHYNAVLDRDLLIKDQLVEWQGKQVRLEVAIDISDAQRLKQTFLMNMQQQNILFDWLKVLSKADNLFEAFEEMMPVWCDYFQADGCFVRVGTQPETCRWYKCTADGNPVLDYALERHLDEWGSLLGKSEQVVIKREDMANSTDGQLLLEGGMESLCLMPVYNGGEMLGLIGLFNQRRHLSSIIVMKMLAGILATAIQKKALQEEVVQIQFTDTLTGWLNFEGYKRMVEQILHRYPKRKYSLWYCDLKKFKFINDVFGYDVGDRLLQFWSDLLVADIREGETFCRISADNFSSLRWYDDIGELEARFNMAAEKLANYEELRQKKFRVEMVSGIYLIEKPEDILELGKMLNKANMAQKSIKALPGSHLAFYNDALRQKEIQEIELTASMREAMKNGEFVLYLQPQVAISSAEVKPVRAEALVRWQRSGQDMIMPGEFISLFEHNGSIVELDYHMMEQVCRFLAALLARQVLKRPICLSVNVSRITMLQPSFLQDYTKLKERYGIPDGCIELEFIESIAVENVEYFTQMVVSLQEHGFLCAMDDFGTGQSSLNVLQNLPLNVLKLDRRFFDGMQDGQRNRIVVSAVLQMAKQLEMDTVAEGIELVEQVEALGEMGCDYIQGYVFSRPLAANVFLARVLEGEL